MVDLSRRSTDHIADRVGTPHKISVIRRRGSQ
jgi:hypothetical protein